jgi:hypothetical protein
MDAHCRVALNGSYASMLVSVAVEQICSRLAGLHSCLHWRTGSGRGGEVLGPNAGFAQPFDGVCAIVVGLFDSEE